MILLILIYGLIIGSFLNVWSKLVPRKGTGYTPNYVECQKFEPVT